MLLWIVLALMTAAVLMVVLWPLAGQRASSHSRAEFDAEIYREQLKEIDNDFDRGLLNSEEADSARIEVSRKLLHAADKVKEGDSHKIDSSNPSATNSMPALIAALVLMPALALTLYLNYGTPGLPDQPHSERAKTPVSQQKIGALVARVEERLRSQPDDGAGWDVIAPVYLKQSRYGDAVHAFEQAIRLLGESPKRLTGLGEAIVFANQGVVTDTARSAFEKALKADPSSNETRFWLAMATEQDGDYRVAAKAWQDLLNRGSKNAPWRKLVEERLKFVQSKIGTQKDVADRKDKPKAETIDKPVTAGGPKSVEKNRERGPNSDQIEAARAMSPEARLAMINQMVAGLADRLKENGNDLDGWQKLINSYVVLGKKGKAQKSLDDARKNFEGNSNALKVLDELAERLDIAS